MNVLLGDYAKISNLFNRSQVLDFINKKDNERKFFKKICGNSKIGLMTYRDIFNEFYENLKKNYRCEYIYLNEIFIKEILKDHDEESTIITELIINKSKVDLLIINGTITAYEIKTELDTLNRLEKQLLDYIQAFDRVYVITHVGFEYEIKKFLKKRENIKKVGIKILNEDGSLLTVKKSGSFIKNYNKGYIFKCLLKKERDFFYKDDYYKAKDIFLKKSNIFIHRYYKKCLLERKKDLEFIEKLPNSLKIIGHKLQNTLNKSQKKIFLEKLNTKII